MICTRCKKFGGVQLVIEGVYVCNRCVFRAEEGDPDGPYAKASAKALPMQEETLFPLDGIQRREVR